MRQTWQSMTKEDKLSSLRSLASKGYSAAQIAAEFPGATRNAVIGLANRSEIKLHGTAKRRHDPEARGKVIEMPAKNPVKEKSKSKAETKPKGPAKIIPIKVKRGPVKMLDLAYDTCRRPLFEDARGLHPDQMFFCGEVTLPESSWCRRCQRVLNEGKPVKSGPIDRNGEPIKLRRPDSSRVRTFDQWRP